MFKEDFDSYVRIGDFIQCSIGNITFTAKLEFDYNTKPIDFDCYSAEEVQMWYDGDWFYGRIILSATIPSSIIGEVYIRCLGSCYGIDCNFNSDNTYLRVVANELLEEGMVGLKELAINILKYT